MHRRLLDVDQSTADPLEESHSAWSQAGFQHTVGVFDSTRRAQEIAWLNRIMEAAGIEPASTAVR
jgi:hypothetical protein